MNTLVVILVGSLLALPLFCGLGYVLYYCFSLPLRRHERARFFLDLVDAGLKDGQSIEHTIQGVSRCDDRSLGRKFWALGALARQGMTFNQALPLIPRFLPDQVIGMLKAGMELGDLRKVLPACRAELKGAVDRVWTAHHYLMLLAFVVTPAWTFVFMVLAVFVFPRFQQIAADMGAGAPSYFDMLVRYYQPLVIFQIGLKRKYIEIMEGASPQVWFFVPSHLALPGRKDGAPCTGGPARLSWLSSVGGVAADAGGAVVVDLARAVAGDRVAGAGAARGAGEGDAVARVVLHGVAGGGHVAHPVEDDRSYCNRGDLWLMKGHPQE